MDTVFKVENLDLYYGEKHALKNINIDIYKNKDGKYCWFLDDKYVVIYSGSSRDFVNNIFFSQIYINY